MQPEKVHAECDPDIRLNQEWLCRDLWMPGACFCLLFATLIAGLVELGRSPTISSPLAISVLWAVYNMISPLLVLW